jgi:hypothetical protein
MKININQFSPFIFTFIIITGVGIHVKAQQQSIGGVYNIEDKALWLKADALAPLLPDNTPVQTWPDAGYYKNDAHALAPGNRPVFKQASPAFNNRPVVEFNKVSIGQMLQIDDHESLDGMPGLTVIAVTRSQNNTTQGIIGKSRLYAGVNNQLSWALTFEPNANNLANRSFQIRVNSNHRDIMTRPMYTDADMVSAVVTGEINQLALFHRGRRDAPSVVTSLNSINRNTGTRISVGNFDETENKWFEGEMAEIVVLRKALNPAQRLIVENVLALKYNIQMVSPGQNFFLNNFRNLPEYSHDIIGIGGVVNEDQGFQKHTASLGGGGGLYLSEAAGTIDEPGEFVFAGHNNAAFYFSTDDLPADPNNLVNRLSRTWRVERRINNGNGTSIRLGFDFSEAGLPVSPDNLYVLLYRVNQTGTFTALPISAAASGNRVTFTVPDTHFKTGYYTVAQTSITVKSWSTASSGNWNDPATWIGNNGYPGQNPANDKADNIIINDNHIVEVNQGGLHHGDLWIKAGGRLNINETRNHFFNTIRGSGSLQITGNYFPEGDAGEFIKTGGGKVIYNGRENYLLNIARMFNHVEINLADAGTEITLVADYILNGNLIIESGRLKINNDVSQRPLNLELAGDLLISEPGSLLTGRGNARHNMVIHGNFINHGNAYFCNLTAPSYRQQPDNGIINLVFNHPAKDQFIQANGTTLLYRLEIAKSLNNNLFLKADAPGNFFLWGQNNLPQTDGFWAPNLPNPNALGLLSGSLVIEHNVHIPVLKTDETAANRGYYLIDEDARIIVNGGTLELPYNDDYKSWGIGLYGSLIVNDGKLRIEGNQGITLYRSGKFEITGGIAEMNMFKTTSSSGNHVTHNGAYVQHGGTAIIRHVTVGADGNTDYYRFTLPDKSNTFIMTGGELIVSSTRATNVGAGIWGGIVIASSPENYVVTGGTVTAIIDKNRNFTINSAAPFYNLNLVRENQANVNFILSPYPHEINSPTPIVQAHPLRVLNRLTITGGARPAALDLNGYELIIDKDITLDAGAGLLAESSVITFSGNTNSRFTSHSPTRTFVMGRLNLEKINSTDTLILNFTQAPLDFEALKINTLLKINNGILDFGSQRVTLMGNLELNSRVGITPEKGRLLLQGQELQQITISRAEATASISHLVIDNPAGVALFNGNIKHIGKLVLNRGVFNLQAHGIWLEGNLSSETGDFSSQKMIVTSGGHSNGGLARMIKEAGTYLYPIGSISGNEIRFTPLMAAFSQVTENVFVQVNPVNNALSTLAGNSSDEALRYYWRVRHESKNNLPKVNHYIFTYDERDLPSPVPPAFTPGKIVNASRHAEPQENFNAGNTTLTFTMGSPFTLETGEYTAAARELFDGQVRIFYSKASTDLSTPALWNSPATWTFDASHSGDDAGEIPGWGDLTVIGITDSGPHAVLINTEVNVAGLKFLGNETFLPRLIIANHNPAIDLGVISGEGILAVETGTNAVKLSGNYEDFLERPLSEVIFFSHQPGTYTLPPLFHTYPNLSIYGPGIMNLPAVNMHISQKMTIAHEAEVWLSDQMAGDLQIAGNLQIGNQATHGGLIYPISGNARKVVVLGDLILLGNNNTFIGIKTEGGTAKHYLTAQQDIIHQAGQMRFFNGNIQASSVYLELAGESDASYTRINTAARPELFRIIMNKTARTDAIFDFTNDFTLSQAAEGPEKPIMLQNGILELAHNGILVNLTSGGSDFVIPRTAGLVLRNARGVAHGTHGITLHGLLRLEGNASLLMAARDSETHIQYGTSGTARLEIADRARLEVATQIRGFFGNDQGVLKYKQTGGEVIVGRRAFLGHSANRPTRGFFEIHNPGSSFHFTGGTIKIVMGYPELNARPCLYLHPATSQVTADASIIIGDPVASPQGRNIYIHSSVALPNLIIDGRSTIASVSSESLTINGNLIIRPNQSFIADSKQITLLGNFTFSGISFNNSNGRFTLKGNNQLISGNDTRFHHLVINPMGVVLLNNINITIEGNLDIMSGILDDGGGTINMKGNLTNNAFHSSSEDSGGLKLSGTHIQHLYGIGTYGRLILDNASGAFVHGPVTVNNLLFINNGVFKINDQQLTLGPHCALPVNENYSKFRMIETTGDVSSAGVQRHIFGSGDFLFPVGTSGNYTPVLVVAENNLSASTIQVAPVNHRHPGIISNGNMLYYWKVTAEGLIDFHGSLQFNYLEKHIDGDINSYLPARLLDGSWEKFDITNINKNQHKLIFDFPSTHILSGDYTAGGMIPEGVLHYRSVASGFWTNPAIWRRVINNTLDDDIPLMHPVGQIAEIDESHVVNTGSEKIVSYMTIINGTLQITPVTAGHYIGEVDGSGIVVLTTSALPGGNYSAFALNGTLEYSGNTNYTLDPARFPVSGIHNLIFSGTGIRTLPSVSLIVNGNFEIKDEVVVHFSPNNPSMILRGNINKSASSVFSATPAGATLIFNGNTPQQIGGQFTGSSRINSIVIDNPSGVWLQGSVEVVQLLNLKNGKVFTSPERMLRLLSSATVSGAANDRFVDGPMQKQGATRFVFPVGSGNRLGRIAVRPSVTSPWSPETIIEAMYFTDVPPDHENTDKNPLYAISSVEYWMVKPSSADKSATLFGFIEPFSDDNFFSGINIPEQVYISWYDPFSLVWRSIGGLSQVPYIRSNQINLVERNGWFTFGIDATGTDNPLPVELLSFKGKETANGILLEWTTATEINNDFFNIEKSYDGTLFTTIGTVKGAGNSNSVISYSYHDNSPYSGVNYYRLKQTDFDGSYEFSYTIAVKYNTSQSAIFTIFPNPVTEGKVNIHLTGARPEGSYEMLISDMYGRINHQRTLSTDHNGTIQYSAINLHQLSPGVYIIIIQNSTGRFSERIIVK